MASERAPFFRLLGDLEEITREQYDSLRRNDLAYFETLLQKRSLLLDRVLDLSQALGLRRSEEPELAARLETIAGLAGAVEAELSARKDQIAAQIEDSREGARRLKDFRSVYGAPKDVRRTSNTAFLA